MDGYGMDISMLRGPVVKVVLVSSPIGGRRGRLYGVETEQRLSLSEKGGAFLTRYYEMEEDEEWHIRTIRGKLRANRKTVRAVMEGILESLPHLQCVLADDAGDWELILEDSKGNRCRAYGTLEGDCMAALSDEIREKLGRKDLFLFNGIYDRVDRLEFTLHRTEKIRPGDPLPEGFSYVTWDYHEKMVIDRASETVEYDRQIFEAADVKTRYHLEEAVSSFLDGLSPWVFSIVEGNPKDVCVDPLRSCDYTIVLTMEKGGKREIRGSYDKKGLPADWPAFAENFFRFLSYYGLGEIFNAAAYGKVRRREGELIFCAVSFEEGGQEYWYMADSDEYEVGDFVQVPAGVDNHVAIGRVESVVYCQKEEAPYPVDEVKHIMGTAAEAAEGSEGSTR
ncbi:hypothetical protein [uncultured Dialister sp.]|jgi:hypothetical protein|uniref:hypothetical protein n=1 Tax=uncultured Dialister sp. TaxID=278064 RepID=UPI0025FD73F3|nr:hypothetical protein [uncultured Dialister sp.]